MLDSLLRMLEFKINGIRVEYEEATWKELPSILI